MQPVYILRVGKMRAAQGLCERILFLRRGDEMDVVGHEAISVNEEAVLRRGALEQAEVYAAIIVDEEHVLMIVAALRDVVRATGNDDSGDTWHAAIIYNGGGEIK